jgi:hypothetical protein
MSEQAFHTGNTNDHRHENMFSFTNNKKTKWLGAVAHTCNPSYLGG